MKVLRASPHQRLAAAAAAQAAMVILEVPRRSS